MIMKKTQDFNAYWRGWLLLLVGFLLPLSAMAEEVTLADSNGNVLRYQFTDDGPATFVGVKTYSTDADKAGRIIIADQVTDNAGNTNMCTITLAAGDAYLSVSPTTVEIPRDGSTSTSVGVTSNTTWIID
jgi:hypothetical protein